VFGMLDSLGTWCDVRQGGKGAHGASPDAYCTGDTALAPLLYYGGKERSQVAKTWHICICNKGVRRTGGTAVGALRATSTGNIVHAVSPWKKFYFVVITLMVHVCQVS